MQQIDDQAAISLDEVVTRSGLAARRIADDLSWGEGAIKPLAEPTGDQRQLVEAVLKHIEPVSKAESDYSICTDGRQPVKLLNGEKVPVREQIVGADMVSAFYVAEVLGGRFYADPDAPVAERIAEVADFLHENGLLPSSHVSCGAAGGFATIVRNVTRFSRKPAYRARLKALLPEGMYDAELHEDIVADVHERLDAGAYKDLTAGMFLDAAKKVSGERAVAVLKNDGRGVNGHVEEAIVRVHLAGQAINTAKMARSTGGRQIFGVNDTRMERLARLFARGNDQDYRIARIALEDFASSGHGTLAKDLPTYVITKS